MEEKWKERTGELKSEAKVLSKEVCWRERKGEGSKRKVVSTREKERGIAEVVERIRMRMERVLEQEEREWQMDRSTNR